MLRFRQSDLVKGEIKKSWFALKCLFWSPWLWVETVRLRSWYPQVSCKLSTGVTRAVLVAAVWQPGWLQVTFRLPLDLLNEPLGDDALETDQGLTESTPTCKHVAKNCFESTECMFVLIILVKVTSRCESQGVKKRKWSQFWWVMSQFWVTCENSKDFLSQTLFYSKRNWACLDMRPCANDSRRDACVDWSCQM